MRTGYHIPNDACVQDTALWLLFEDRPDQAAQICATCPAIEECAEYGKLEAIICGSSSYVTVVYGGHTVHYWRDWLRARNVKAVAA